MSVDVDFSGLDKQFAELAAKTKSGGKKGSKAGADITAAILKKNTPYDPSTKDHMKDDIEETKISDLDEYDVHYGKKTTWRSDYVNDGTIYIKGQHFAEKTEAEAQAPVREAMQKIIDEELKGL